VILSAKDINLHSCKGFLVVEGVNGAGKSTLVSQIANFLGEEGEGKAVVTTFEPGATPLGAHLRRLLLDGEEDGVAPLAELFLFAADRANHVQQKILPALESSKLVISDRYYYSTAAFQGYGRGLDLAVVNTINQLAIGGLLPDLVLLLDLDPELGLIRNQARGANQGRDSFEEEEIAFHKRLREGFLEIARVCKEPVVVLDAACSSGEIWERVKPLCRRWVQAARG
jgi:dTMP kinase